MNWSFGWGMILTAFVSGAFLGLFFHRDDFLGGYGSFRRRLVRLGHIALAALGMINILYALSPVAAKATVAPSASQVDVASFGFLLGGLGMPAVCFLSSWRSGFRYLFPIPVALLIVAVIQTLRMGP